MKKIVSILIVLTGLLVLASCVENQLSFKLEYKNNLSIGEETTVVATKKDGTAFVDAKVSLKIKSGNAFVEIENNKIKGISEGSAKITVTVEADSEKGTEEINITVSKEQVSAGIPKPKTGFYMRDADIIQDGDVRYLVYVTNSNAGEDDNVIAVRKGEKQGDGFSYGAEKVIITPSNDGWDKFIGSASIVKGSYKYNGKDYSYLIAYQGTRKTNDTVFSIGLAVADDVLGTWEKVGNAPLIEYDADIYGEYAGHYAPSLVNLDKESAIRLFYTWADAYGHFTYFVDFDASDLGNLDLSGYVMVTNNGNLATGEDVTMIPNADFVYDSANKVFYMVKDYSPTPSRNPKVATKIELASIDEEELYTAVEKIGWNSLATYDTFDTPDTMYERLYSATIVCDAFGHMLDNEEIEIVYNVSDLEADNVDYIFSQFLLTVKYTK